VSTAVHPSQPIFDFSGGGSGGGDGTVGVKETPRDTKRELSSSEVMAVPTVNPTTIIGQAPLEHTLSSLNYHHSIGKSPLPFLLAQTYESSEKYNKLRKKKEKRAKLAQERNVKVVKKAEDMEGYEGNKEINDLLESLGEQTSLEKKQKIRRNKDKKTKKRRSVEKAPEDENKEDMEEDDDDEDAELATLKPAPLTNGSTQITMSNSPEAEPRSLKDLKNSEGLTQSTDSLNFVKVTGKKKSRKVREEGQFNTAAVAGKLREEVGRVKEYTRKSKEDTGRPPPAQPGGRERRYSGENRRTSNYSLRSRDVPLLPADGGGGANASEIQWSQGPRILDQSHRPPESSSGRAQDQQLQLNNMIDDFPALNTSQDFPALPVSGVASDEPTQASNTQPAGSVGATTSVLAAVEATLPAAWNRKPAGSSASDKPAVIIAPLAMSENNDSVLPTTPTNKIQPQDKIVIVKHEEDDVDTDTCCSAASGPADLSSGAENCDRPAQNNALSSPRQCETEEEETATLAECKLSTTATVVPVTSNIPQLQPVKVVAETRDVAVEDRFEFDTRANPVVIGDYSCTVGDSAYPEELSFGFEVNEELVSLSMAGESTVPSSPLHSGQTTPRPASSAQLASGQSTPCLETKQEEFKAGQVTTTAAPIDSVDNAILSYGGSSADAGLNNGNRMAAVMIPVMVPLGGVANGIPPPFANYISPLSSDVLETGLCDTEDKSSAVSPESGISSASPLSWQVEGSPSQVEEEEGVEGEQEEDIGTEAGQRMMERSAASPPLQPGSYPRKKKNEDRCILQQVNYSLEKWSRSSSTENSQRSSPGWATRVDMSIPLSDDSGLREVECAAPNYPEIVNFLQDNWNQLARDKKAKIYGDKKKRR